MTHISRLYGNGLQLDGRPHVMSFLGADIISCFTVSIVS